MNIAPRLPHMRLKAPRVALAILSAIALVGLSQCKLTPDKLTGVDKAGSIKSSPGACISECAHRANDAMDGEKDLHKVLVQNCHGDPVCLAAEDARHQAAVNAIQDGRKRCMDDCHQQGSGSGGR